jgi:hypothetical protein
MRCLFAFLLVIVSLATQAQELRLDRCGQVPIVKVVVGKKQFRFLLDTGSAPTLLNVKIFLLG